MWFTWCFRPSQPTWHFDLKTDLRAVADALAEVCRANGLDNVRGAN